MILTDEQELILITEYLSGQRVKSLCRKYHKDSRDIKKILVKHKIAINHSLRKDLKGQVFGKLTVKYISHVDKWRAVHWWCQCDCGNPELFTVNNRDIQNGNIKSCGCLRIEADKHRFKDLIGLKVNHLTVRKRVGVKIGKKMSSGFLRKDTLWECECDCKTETPNIIIVKAGALLSNNTKSCGCINHKIGPDNPRWNLNLTQEERDIKRYTTEYNEWSKLVKKRDNWICQISGEKSIYKKGGLCAHHLDGWGWCKEKRYDLSNGITLSKPIHILFHNLYGRGENTKDQFLEFKSRYDSGEWLDYQI